MISPAEAKRKRIEVMAHFLYDRMPGAPRVPTDDGWKMWGEVESNDHFIFCEAVAALIERVDTRVHVEAD